MVTYPEIGEQFVKELLRVIFGREFRNLSVTAQEVIYGADYDELKNVVIIMIVPYDPFGLDRMVYTIKNHCVEVPDMPYERRSGDVVFVHKGDEGEARPYRQPAGADDKHREKILVF